MSDENIAFLALLLSFISLVWAFMVDKRQKNESVNASLGTIVQIEHSLANIKSAFKFHGIYDEDLDKHKVSREELAYLVASFTAGGIYHRTHSPNDISIFPEDSYRYNMCLSQDTRKAWPLVERMMNKGKFVERVGYTIDSIENKENQG